MSDTLALPFAQIPTTWSVPGVYDEIQPTYATGGIQVYPTRALVIGQALPGSSGVPGTVYPLTRTGQGAALFGVGSQAAIAADAWITANPLTPCYMTALPDASGATKATGSIVVAGAPTANAVLPNYVGGVAAPVTVSTSNTATSIAAKVAAALTGAPGIPVTAAVGSGGSSGTVTLTALQGGEVGNLDVRNIVAVTDAVPPGLTIACTSMTGGAGNPTLLTVLDAISTDWYTDIVIPWTDGTNLAAYAAELARRYGAMVQLDAIGYVGTTGSLSTLMTLASTLNEARLSAIGAWASPSPPWLWGVTYAAIATFNLAQDPSRQLRTLALPGIVAPAVADRFTPAEQNQLLDPRTGGGGVSTFDVLQDGTVVIQRAVSSYRESASGAADIAWRDIMVAKTQSVIRYDWRTYMSLQYPRAKLANDGDRAARYAGPDNVVMTPRRALGAYTARAVLYNQQGWIQPIPNAAPGSTGSNGTNTGGSTTGNALVGNTFFQLNSSDPNRLDGAIQINQMGNLMVLATIQMFDAA